MAASSSVRKPMGPRRKFGQISNRKMATASASGTDMATASKDDTIVPQMKGNAPNSPETGSQMLCVKNLNPKAWIDSCDFAIKTQTMRITMRKIDIAQTTIKAWKLPSMSLPELLFRKKVRIAEGSLIFAKGG